MNYSNETYASAGTQPEEFSITNYIFQPGDLTEGHVSYTEYCQAPGVAFFNFCKRLNESVETFKEHEFDQERHKFPRERLPIVQYYVNSAYALLMGHFETYQKRVFAGVFEKSVYLEDFHKGSFLSRLGIKGDKVSITTEHLLAARGGEEEISIGILLADSLGSWHDPGNFCKFFCAFTNQQKQHIFGQILEDQQKEVLAEMWQVRHSIVHTAATLTKSDALKVSSLEKYSGQTLVMKVNTIYESQKYLLSVVRSINKKIEAGFNSQMPVGASHRKREEIRKLLSVPDWAQETD